MELEVEVLYGFSCEVFRSVKIIEEKVADIEKSAFEIPIYLRM